MNSEAENKQQPKKTENKEKPNTEEQSKTEQPVQGSSESEQELEEQSIEQGEKNDIDAEDKEEDENLQYLKNINLRLQADIENIRKRHQKELSAAHKYGQEKLMRELLPVLDSFEMGVHSVEENEANKALLEGMKLTGKMLKESLQKHQLSSIEPQGEKFNPELHEAMTSMPVAGVEENIIVEVIQKGYTLPDRLLRPARVIVAAKQSH